MYQHLALRVPHLKGDFAFVRMSVNPGLGFPESLIERLIQLRVLGTRHRHTHYALQQACVLRQLRVVDLGDFVVAVMHIEEAEYRQTGQ